MSNVIAAVMASQQIPQRIVGNVSVNKDGSISIDYREPGMVKTKTARFLSSEVVAHMEGEAGFVVAMSSDPITKMVGKMTVKGDKVILESEAGDVVINKVAGATVIYTEADEDSREAKAAARVAKVRGVKVKKEGKKSKKGKADKKEKKSKKGKAEKSDKKKKKKSKKD